MNVVGTAIFGAFSSRSLGRFSKHPALTNSADFEPLNEEKNCDPFVYLRRAGKESIIVSINPAGKSCAVGLNEVIKATRLFVRGAEFRDSHRLSPGVFALLRARFFGPVELAPDQVEAQMRRKKKKQRRATPAC